MRQEIASRVYAELPLLERHLRRWVESHLTEPREITAWSDVDETEAVRVWRVTEHIGEDDASSKVVYDAARKMLGFVRECRRPNQTL